MLQPGIPQKLRSIGSTILIANGILWSDPKLGEKDLGTDTYIGISADSDGVIRNSWLELARVRLKEVTDEFAPKGTSVLWALYFTVERGIQKAHFVQISHRQDTLLDSEPFTDISDH